MPRNTVAPNASSLTLPSDTEIVLVRSFAAPRDLVWRAFSDPKLVPKWYGPTEPPMTVCEMDVRPNGKFRWAWGTAFETAGIFHQVEKPRLLVMESREPDPTPEVRSHTFDEKDGRTRVTIRIKTASKTIRDQLLASGAIEGMEPTFVRLDAFLPSLQ
ncbi:MAG TPA: SRPBCC domain-containing protein [Candidatus Thermoplasmatota archaeon]|nr:SRPBCC domain-containing protein [Candidatus Thermoplasmatota archaeon]